MKRAVNIVNFMGGTEITGKIDRLLEIGSTDGLDFVLVRTFHVGVL